MLYLIFMFFILFVGVYISVWFLLVALSNTSRLHEELSLNYFPNVSILIPAHNEEAYITRSAESIARLDYPKKKLEVIIIDNGSTDNTAKRAEQFRKRFSEKLKGVKVLRMPKPAKSEALTTGIKYASGELIGILDADTFVTKDCLRKMLPYFRDSKVAAVTNYVKPSNDKGIMASLQGMEYIFSSFSKKIISLLDALYIVPGTMSLIRKDVIKKIGFPGDTLTEDMDIALCILKSGYRIANSLDAIAYTVVPTTFIGLLQQRIRWYRGFIQNMSKHSDLLFNRNYPHLGYFVFPFSSVLAIFVGVALTMMLVTNTIRDLLLFVKRFFYIEFLDAVTLYTTIPLKTFAIEKLFLDPYSRIVYAMILTSSIIVLFVALRLQKIGIRGKLLLFPIYFFVYYLMIMIFWFLSVLTEIFRFKRRW